MNKEIRYMFEIFRQFKQVFFMILIVLSVLFLIPVYFQADPQILWIFFGLVMNLIGIGTAIFVLGYQYNASTVDFYYGLPLKRGKIFFLHQFVGLIMIIIPTLIIGAIICISLKVGFSNLLFLIIHLTTMYCIFSLITTLTNNHLDSLFLIGCYYAIPFIGSYTLYGIFIMYFYGFYANPEVIAQIYMYSALYVPLQLRSMVNIWIYLLSFGVITTVTLYLTHYFNYHRKVEQSGAKISHPRIFSLINILLIVIYCSLLAAIRGSYISRQYGTYYKISEIFSLSTPLAIGLIIYLIVVCVQQKRIINVIKYTLNYIMVTVVYFSVFLLFLKFIVPIYDNNIPAQAKKVIVEYKSYAYFKDIHEIPAILDTQDNSQKMELKVTNPEEIKEITTLHSNIVKNRNNRMGKFFDITLKYEQAYGIPLIRRYGISEASASVLFKTNGIFAQRLMTLLDEQKDDVVVTLLNAIESPSKIIHKVMSVSDAKALLLDGLDDYYQSIENKELSYGELQVEINKYRIYIPIVSVNKFSEKIK